MLADVGAFLDTQFSDDKRAGTKCGGMIRDQFGTRLSRAWDKAGLGSARVPLTQFTNRDIFVEQSPTDEGGLGTGPVKWSFCKVCGW